MQNYPFTRISPASTVVIHIKDDGLARALSNPPIFADQDFALDVLRCGTPCMKLILAWNIQLC
jgi:hypothetical protein